MRSEKHRQSSFEHVMQLEMESRVVDCRSEGEQPVELAAEKCLNSLPHEILQDILARLPLWTLAQARSVCQEWNRIACHDYHGGEKQQPWCLMAMSHSSAKVSANFCGAKCMAFDPSSARWFTLPLPPVDNPTKLVLSAVGESGLVILSTAQYAQESGGEQYWTGNPLTGRWHKLPECHAAESAMGDAVTHEVVLCPGSKTYKVVHFRSIYTAARYQPGLNLQGAFSWGTYVYEFGTTEWKKGAAIRRTRPIDRETFSSCVSNGVVYFSQAYFRAGFVEIEVFAYDAEQDRFSVVVPASAFLLSARSVLSPDQIQVYIDADEGRDVRLLALITVWEADLRGAAGHSCQLASLSFHGDLLRWVVDWQTSVPSSDATNLICFASGDGGKYVYLTSRTPSCSVLSRTPSCRVLIYDRTARQWIASPRYQPGPTAPWVTFCTSSYLRPRLRVDWSNCLPISCS